MTTFMMSIKSLVKGQVLVFGCSGYPSLLLSPHSPMNYVSSGLNAKTRAQAAQGFEALTGGFSFHRN